MSEYTPKEKTPENRSNAFSQTEPPDQPGYYAANNPCGTVKRLHKQPFPKAAFSQGFTNDKPPEDKSNKNNASGLV